MRLKDIWLGQQALKRRLAPNIVNFRDWTLFQFLRDCILGNNGCVLPVTKIFSEQAANQQALLTVLCLYCVERFAKSFASAVYKSAV